MLTLLHTSPTHVPVFDALRDEHHPGLVLRHLVHEDLLTRAREAGPRAVAGEVREVLAAAVEAGATAVLCTCSTIGGIAEDAGLDVPVLRVDRPMAAEAVRRDRIVVVAALGSTLAPTLDLIAEEALRADRAPRVRTALVDGAWERFEAGDRDGYLEAIARTVDRIAAEGDAEVIVLAQASMASARVGGEVPVLSSPRGGLAAAAAAASDGRPNG